ncbi:MAG: ribonuclease H-like domain-containing protein [Candidatus Paceibacterota bacterium]
MRRIVFDIETKNFFHDVGAYDPTKLDISVVGVYDSEKDTYKAYLEEELSSLWPVLEQADMLIGYNSDHFDIPLLNKYYQGDLSRLKSIDLLKEIKNSIGKRLRLDSVAEATLGLHKTGQGADAMNWWKQGEIEKVKNYCLHDVKITKELYEYALSNNKLFYMDFSSKVGIPLNTKTWEEKEDTSLTHTLPF